MTLRTVTIAPVEGGSTLPAGVEIVAPVPENGRSMLSHSALAFAASLERRFAPARRELLARRAALQRRLDAGWRPDFPAETRALRERAWTIAPTPPDLQDRRVEITGPAERKMVINALNSGASVFMADFEDSLAPTWTNVVLGQQNLYDAVRRTIEYRAPETGKEYRLAERTAVLMARPRGWHLIERHVEVDGRPMSASLFDFALYAFHNARELLSRGTGPYFYLPKLESHLEARLWNEVFTVAEDELALPPGSIKATVLIETLLAAFEMDEILWELRDHAAGLNCGRWDYIFSFIKKLRRDPSAVLPERGRVTMETHFLRSYSQLLIQTCHRRGAHAMGGMAAQIPIKDDAEKNRAALERVRADKRREVGDGHDGTWVAHPGLVALAREEFERVMTGPNQLANLRADVSVRAEDLLCVPSGPITAAGLEQNVSIGLAYLAAWLTGSGCVPLRDLMEDAATAEISRTQLWQWIHHAARLDDGRAIDWPLVRGVLEQELERLRTSLGPARFAAGRYELAARLLADLIAADDLADFLTLCAYDHLAESESR